MDESVIRALKQWPNVPAVFGWLQLDRRGRWLVKTAAGRFEATVNKTMIEFIGRNYTHDDRGRWYFQNGPQRVYVTLDYTPWVYRIDDAVGGFATHTGAPAEKLMRLLLDETHTLLLETEQGVGVLLDRDLETLLTHLHPTDGRSVEAILEAIPRDAQTLCRLFGQTLPVEHVSAGDIPARFRFVPRPIPEPGQPEC